MLGRMNRTMKQEGLRTQAHYAVTTTLHSTITCMQQRAKVKHETDLAIQT